MSTSPASAQQGGTSASGCGGEDAEGTALHVGSAGVVVRQEVFNDI